MPRVDSNNDSNNSITNGNVNGEANSNDNNLEQNNSVNNTDSSLAASCSNENCLNLDSSCNGTHNSNELSLNESLQHSNEHFRSSINEIRVNNPDNQNDILTCVEILEKYASSIEEGSISTDFLVNSNMPCTREIQRIRLAAKVAVKHAHRLKKAAKHAERAARKMINSVSILEAAIWEQRQRQYNQLNEMSDFTDESSHSNNENEDYIEKYLDNEQPCFSEECEASNLTQSSPIDEDEVLLEYIVRIPNIDVFNAWKQELNQKFGPIQLLEDLGGMDGFSLSFEFLTNNISVPDLNQANDSDITTFFENENISIEQTNPENIPGSSSLDVEKLLFSVLVGTNLSNTLDWRFPTRENISYTDELLVLVPSTMNNERDIVSLARSADEMSSKQINISGMVPEDATKNSSKILILVLNDNETDTHSFEKIGEELEEKEFNDKPIDDEQIIFINNTYDPNSGNGSNPSSMIENPQSNDSSVENVQASTSFNSNDLRNFESSLNSIVTHWTTITITTSALSPKST